MNTEERKAEEYANSKGYQSDKEQYTKTPWCEWNLRRDAFLAGYSSKQSELEERVKELEKVLRELVELKDMKDSLVELEYNDPNEYYKVKSDYQTRKPLAWEAARKYIKPKE